MTTKFLVGDVFAGLATIPDNSVDLIISSPPFLALRSYLPADHPDKALEIGSEATPGEFLDRLLDVVEECARVLAPHGSLVFELGDTYAGGGQGPDPGKYAAKDAVVTIAATHGPGWPLDKSKVLVPQLFAIALAYGFNPLTGRQTDPWRVRNVVSWNRPNPPVGRDGDKFRPATSCLTVATKARDRYWDGDAVRSPGNSYDRTPGPNGTGAKSEAYAATGQTRGRLTEPHKLVTNPAGAPLLDYWVIPTEPYSGSHYATFPRALVVPLVKSMAPQKVCRVCGEPSRRITTPSERYEPHRKRFDDAPDYDRERMGTHGYNHATKNAMLREGITTAEYETVGWTDCGHNDWRAGCVLDPFAGSGTTLQVASGHGLDSIGIDLDARNAELARERVGGLFLEIETLGAAEAV